MQHRIRTLVIFSERPKLYPWITGLYILCLLNFVLFIYWLLSTFTVLLKCLYAWSSLLLGDEDWFYCITFNLPYRWNTLTIGVGLWWVNGGCLTRTLSTSLLSVTTLEDGNISVIFDGIFLALGYNFWRQEDTQDSFQLNSIICAKVSLATFSHATRRWFLRGQPQHKAVSTRRLQLRSCSP